MRANGGRAMTIDQALQLRDSDRVMIRYKGNPGHGTNIQEYGKVIGQPNPNCRPGAEYIWVNVYVPSQGHASVFPSHCLW